MSQIHRYLGDKLMMGRQSPPQSKLFYTTDSLEKRVRKDHPLRKIAKTVDFDFMYGEKHGVTYEKGCQVTGCTSPLRPFLRVS